MDIQAMLAFLIYVLINAFTPGPGNILALILLQSAVGLVFR